MMCSVARTGALLTLRAPWPLHLLSTVLIETSQVAGGRTGPAVRAHPEQVDTASSAPVTSEWAPRPQPVPDPTWRNCSLETSRGALGAGRHGEHSRVGAVAPRVPYCHPGWGPTHAAEGGCRLRGGGVRAGLLVPERAPREGPRKDAYVRDSSGEEDSQSVPLNAWRTPLSHLDS